MRVTHNIWIVLYFTLSLCEYLYFNKDGDDSESFDSSASIFTQDSRALVGSESVVVSIQTDSVCETITPSLMRNELVLSSSPGDHSSSLTAPIHGS